MGGCEGVWLFSPTQYPKEAECSTKNAVQWLTLQSQYLVIYVAQLNYCLLTISIQEVAEGQRVCGSENKRPDFMTNQ